MAEALGAHRLLSEASVSVDIGTVSEGGPGSTTAVDREAGFRVDDVRGGRANPISGLVNLGDPPWHTGGAGTR